MGNAIDRELDEASRTGKLNLSNHSVNQVPSRLLQKLPYDALVELQLNNNQLLALPSQLGKLVRLQVLSVRNNALIALPSEATKLKALQELDLYSNKIAKLPSSLGKLTSLTRLILQQNKLSSLPSSIGELTALQLLYISNNKLTSLPDSIGNLKELTILSVSENSLKALPASIGGLTSLTSLNVSKNKLTELPPSLGKLAGLVQLIACNNRITTVPEELGALNSVQTVDLAFNKLQSVPQRLFEKWVSVETVRLNNNQLIELPASLGNLANLTSLDVKDNRIKDLPPEIGYLKNLRELMIDGNKLNALPAEFDEIEDSIERFTYDNNPFSSKLLTFDHDELYDEGDEEDFAFSDEDGDWETKLVFQMLKDGEVFIRHEKGKPGQQVHLQISPELDTIKWTQRGPRLRRQTSWSGSSKPGVVTEGKDSDKKQSELRYLKGGTVRVGGGSRLGGSVVRATLDTDMFQPRSPRSPRAPGNAAGLIGQAGAALEPKKQEEKKEPNSITIADVEEVAVGKEAVKHVEGAKVVSEDLCFCLVCPERAILLEARSSAERDEWARAFLMLLKYWIKGTIKDSDDEEEEEDAATSDEEDSMQQSRDDDSSAGSMQQSREDDESTMSQSADAVLLAESPSTIKKKKKKKSKLASGESKKSSGKKKKSKSGEGKSKKSKSTIARPGADESEAAAAEGDKKKKKKKKKKEDSGSTLKKSKTKKLKRKKTKKFANRAEELADIEQAIHSGEVHDDEMRKMVEEIRQLEAETSKLEAEEIRKKEEEARKVAEELKRQQQAEGLEVDDDDDATAEEQEAARKADEEKQRQLKEQEEAQAEQRKQEEQLATARREADEKKRQEEEEKKQKEAEEAEERRLKEEEERMKKDTERRLQIEHRKKEALEKRAQERQAKLEQLRQGITIKKPEAEAAGPSAAGGVRFAVTAAETPKTAEEKKKELFEQRAREREARLAALRNFGQQKKEEAIKEKEELEKEAEERKQRLVALKAASVKRFNEKHAVLQAIKMKEEEIRQKAEEEERERAAQQQQKQQQAEKQQQQQAESAAAKEKEERDRKDKEERERQEKEDKARKEREEREKKEKEKEKQLLQPAKSPRATDSPARKVSVLDAVTSDGSTILAAPQKTRARAPTGKRLPTIRSRAERAEERREQLRQASIPRAERQIVHEAFKVAQATLPKFCRECGVPLRGPFCTGCGAKIEATELPASPASVARSSPAEAQPGSSADAGLTEAEKMRQRIFQRKAAAAGAGSPAASPEPLRGQVAESSPSADPAAEEDYEEMMRRRRAESILKKKEDEKQDRKNIIKAFHEKAKEKDENFVEKLVQLKGRRKVQSTLIEKTAKAMNEGDAYLLYSRDTLYVFYGQEANRMEKAKALELTKRINFHECGGRAQVVTVRRKADSDFNEKDEKRDAASKTFWQLLGGGKEEDLMSAEAGGNDIAFERTFHSQLTLEKLHKVEGQFKSEMVDFGTHPTKDLLEKDKCYLLDCGPGSVYVWLGRNANPDHRTWAINYANDIRGQEGRSEWLYIERETDGGESILFREKFVGWGEANEGPFGSPIPGGGSPIALKKKKTGTLNRVKSRVRLTSALEKRKKEQERVDIRALHTGVRPVLDVPWANDDGQSGTLEMWIVNNKTYELEEYSKEKHGIFYSAEAYVMLWTYRHGGFTGQSEQIRWLIYYWQGAHASRQDKGAAAMKTKDILDIVKRRGGDADTVRVAQGKEPLHFLKLFQGRMIVHLGPQGKHSAKKDALYHVRGLADAFAMRAVQIPAKRKWLNSRDCFLLTSGGKQLFLWQGEGASDALRRQATVLADVLAKDLGRTSAPVVVRENLPSKEWEKAIGKKQEYPCAPHLKRSHGWRPRLFVCSSTSGEFRVDEVFDYAQEDLEPSNIYLLDAWAEVFVWIGSKSYEEDERMAMETAVAYVQGATDGRLLDAPVYSIRENDESLEFTCHFQAWDDGWGAELVKGKKKASKKKKTETQNVRALLAELNRVYTYEELKAKPPPKGLDKTKLEQYLSEEEFKTVLQMTKDEFYALPPWKQNKLRQQASLY